MSRLARQLPLMSVTSLCLAIYSVVGSFLEAKKVIDQVLYTLPTRNLVIESTKYKFAKKKK